MSRLGAPAARIRVEVPEERQRLAPVDAEPVVERRAPATRLRDTPGADPHLVDPDRERLPHPCPAYLDGPDQSVAGVELAVASFRKELVLRACASLSRGS